MWKYCPSIFAGLAGLVCVTPLFAIACTPSAPKEGGKCFVAHVDGPEPTGNCYPADGGCFSWGCSGTAFGIAQGGACEPFDPTGESGLQCVENSGAITLELAEYAARCNSAESCGCVWEDTGEVQYEEVCNCTDNSN